jgi:hypothetical protein
MKTPVAPTSRPQLDAMLPPKLATSKEEYARVSSGRMSLAGDWSLRFSEDGKRPEFQTKEVISCRVPGGIHAALMASGKLADISKELGFIEAMAWEKKHKWLTKSFDWELSSSTYPVWLVFEGVDPNCEIFLNGHLVCSFEGMFGGPSVEVTSFLLDGRNEVLVHILPENVDTDSARRALVEGRPIEIDHPAGNRYLKPAQLLGGNGFPRLITAGIWQPAWIELRPPQAVCDLWAETVLAKKQRAELLIHGRIHGRVANEPVEVSLSDPSGAVCWKETAATDAQGQFKLTALVESPKLWWPNGSGSQPLYELLAHSSQRAVFRRRVGIRTVEWRRNPGTEAELTLTVNGVPIFARGGNWPTLDKTLDFTHAAERYEWLLRLAQAANVNVLRFWGGYAKELDAFYEQCDSKGILILHDFPVSNTVNAQNVDRDIYANQVRHVVRQLRFHPCIAAWIGGNELRQCEIIGSPMDQLTSIGGEIVREENPARRYFASSYLLRPGMTDEYDHFGRRAEAIDVFTGPLAAEPKFSVEFSSGSHSFFVASEGLAAKLFPLTGHKWPPSPRVHLRKINTSNWSQRFMAGSLPARGSGADAAPYTSWEEMSYYTDLFHGFGARALVGNWRSLLFRCSGALVWCWNDQQAMFGWGAVDYFGAPKALYYFLKRAFAPVVVNFRYLTPELDFRERIRSGVSIVNESGKILRDYSVRIGIYNSDLTPIMPIGPESEQTRIRSGAKLYLHTSALPVENGASIEAVDLNGVGYLFPLFEQCGMTACDLDSEQRPDRRFFGLVASLHDGAGRLFSREFYPFNFAWHDSAEVKNMPQAVLKAEIGRHAGNQLCYKVTNTSDVPCLWARFTLEDTAPEDCVFSDNWLTILPKEKVAIGVSTRKPGISATPGLRWRAVNSAGRISHS